LGGQNAKPVQQNPGRRKVRNGRGYLVKSVVAIWGLAWTKKKKITGRQRSGGQRDRKKKRGTQREGKTGEGDNNRLS